MTASIEYIETIIAAYGAATDANWRTPGREGNVVFLEPELAQDVMITGDLHGHRRNFNRISKIANLAAHRRRHLILQEVCHGGPTYPANGGCMSHNMLEDVAKLIAQYPDRVHFLLGNHELAEMTEYPIQKKKQMLNLLFRLGLQQMYGPATDRVREAMVQFIQSCPLGAWMPGGVLITHSIPEKVNSAVSTGRSSRAGSTRWSTTSGPRCSTSFGGETTARRMPRHSPGSWKPRSSSTATSRARKDSACRIHFSSCSIVPGTKAVT